MPLTPGGVLSIIRPLVRHSGVRIARRGVGEWGQVVKVAVIAGGIGGAPSPPLPSPPSPPHCPRKANPVDRLCSFVCSKAPCVCRAGLVCVGLPWQLIEKVGCLQSRAYRLSAQRASHWVCVLAFFAATAASHFARGLRFRRYECITWQTSALVVKGICVTTPQFILLRCTWPAARGCVTENDLSRQRVSRRSTGPNSRSRLGRVMQTPPRREPK